MAAAESSEVQALGAAMAELRAGLDGLEGVDVELAAELGALPGVLAAINPVSPAQVNAVAAAASRVASVVARLKGTEALAGAPATEAPDAPFAAHAGWPQQTTTTLPPVVEQPSVGAVAGAVGEVPSAE